ncbi:hypothetical protein A8990_11494 [Paenibacillus taihuensis]|uniref:Uncharacterized protein n=1 Tax=Paenibacillus taihuensis TaxID=1156355 RepID=A0A3D9RX50_9BACL|nr:hypothetical protein [Paenibacillus taihuensis]REE84559.1 hypothetical protein A8990_11494 [Paenibacillus taihuensis]
MISQMIKQDLIDELISLSLNTTQWNSLARNYYINPADIYSEKSTNPEKAEALVERICQLGAQENLITTAKGIIYQNTEFVPALGEKLSKLDYKVALKFGNLYKELLQKIEEAESNPDTYNFDENNDENEDHRKIIKFQDKLENRAKFSESNRELAIEKRNENSVLRRKAQKLGFGKYEDLTKRIRHIYNNRILPICPPKNYSADYRLTIILNELFEYLPIDYQEDDEAEDYLYGMIFETMFQCFIFNE